MNNFRWYRPTDFHFGRGEENHVGEITRAHGATRVLLHFGGQSAVKSGLLGRVEASLEAAGVTFVKLGGVKPNPRADLVYEGIRLCREQQLTLVLAVGGGSVMDSAKDIAMGVPYEGDFWDFFMGGKVPEKALPVGCVVTLAASGSEGSNSAVINKDVNGVTRKKGSNFQTSIPEFAILNPELTMSLPPYETACGVADIMSHVIERYFTNTREVEITDQLCEGVLRTLVKMGPRVLARPDDYEARAAVMWASTLAHNDICGTGREQDWGSHRIEMELSALYDVAHGAGLTVVMPAWMDYVYKHDVARFARFAVQVFGVPMDFYEPERTAREGIAALRRFWGSLGLPLNFAQLGARAEDIPAMVEHMGGAEHTEGHFVILKGADIQKIFEIAAAYDPKAAL